MSGVWQPGSCRFHSSQVGFADRHVTYDSLYIPIFAEMADANRAKGPVGWLTDWKTFKATVRGWMGVGAEYGMMGYMFSRQIGWYIVTTAMITALPLVFEYNREGIVEDLEALQIADAIDKGAAPQQLAQQGMTSAVGPKVLK